MDGNRSFLIGDFPQARAAVAYAQHKHAGQRRGADGAPFILHPLEVAWLLCEAGAPEHVIAAGVLHDALEKTSANATELRERFGKEVERLVRAVSEDDRVRSYHGRKAALRRQVAAAGPEAMMVFAADKISKVRELALLPVPARWAIAGSPALQRRMTHYWRCLELLEKRLSDSPLVRQLRTEFDALNESPGARSPLADAI